MTSELKTPLSSANYPIIKLSQIVYAEYCITRISSPWDSKNKYGSKDYFLISKFFYSQLFT